MQICVLFKHQGDHGSLFPWVVFPEVSCQKDRELLTPGVDVPLSPFSCHHMIHLVQYPISDKFAPMGR